MNNLDNINKYIDNKIAQLFRHNRLIKKTFEDLNHTNELFIFGGWVRDIIISKIHNKRIIWKDIDVVVNGVSNMDKFPHLYQNRFGGYKYYVGNKKSIHFWNIEETYAFKKGIFKSSPQNLCDTAIFKFNSIVYDVSRKTLIETGAINEIREKKISFNCKEYVWDFPELQIFRAIEFEKRFKFSLDKEVVEFMKVYISENSPTKYLTNILPHRDWVSITDVEMIYNDIRKK